MDSLFLSKPKYPRSTQNNTIPHDIIIDILTHLPVKSLIRFKSVSKSWYSLIKDEKFIKQHYDTRKSCQENYFVVCRRQKIKNQFDYYHYTMELDSTSIASLVESPVPIDQSPLAFRKIQCFSCNGILFIADANDIIIMWNPATRESRRIPPSSKSGGLYNFCYFPSIKCYKIFRLGIGVIIDSNDMDIDIFSTKTNTWRTVGIFPPNYYFEEYRVYMSEGIAYMMAERRDNQNSSILRFCMEKEEFQQELLIPNTISPREINVVGEKHCLIGSLKDNDKIRVYCLYMKKTNSWNEILAIQLPFKTCLTPLSFIKDGGIMFQTYVSKCMFKTYNSTTHKLENVNVAGIEGLHFLEVVTYVETLSSPFL